MPATIIGLRVSCEVPDLGEEGIFCSSDSTLFSEIRVEAEEIVEHRAYNTILQPDDSSTTGKIKTKESSDDKDL